MTSNRALTVAAAFLMAVGLIAVGYRFRDRQEDGDSQKVQRIVREQLAPLSGIEERLAQLEQTVESLRQGSSAGSVEGGEPDADGGDRWAAVESGLSELQLRVKGLEDDPVRRGYSYLESENAELRREGVEILRRVARFDPEARAALRALLRDPSSRVREQAAQRLRDLEDKESAPDMVALLSDSDSRTRRRAVQALGSFAAHDAARDIGQTLVSDADARVRQEAADVLGRLKSPEAAEFLTEALKDQNESVRGEAIASLGEIGATSAAPLLRAMYDDGPGNHRRRLVLALKSLGDEGPLQTEIGRLSALVKTDTDDGVRVRAIRELALLARDSSQAVFSAALEDASPRVRREAEKALR